MTSTAERIGAALAKALKGALKGSTNDAAPTRPAAVMDGPPIRRANIRNVPKVSGPEREDGWLDAQLQVLIDKPTADADHTLGWTVLKPGGRHQPHRLRHCDAFLLVLKGRGHVYSDLGEEPAVEGDVVYAPRGAWHGFHNTSNDDVILIWGWMGAGSFEDSGYEAHSNNRKR